MHKKILIPIILLSLTAGFGGGFFYANSNGTNLPIFGNLINRDAGQPQNIDFTEFWHVWDALHNDYVDKDKLNDRDLIFGAISGLVDSIGDPYTAFLKPKESEKFIQEINGSFGGIGIEIGIRQNSLTVIAPIKGTPAERAGLKAGDKIIKIGDKNTFGIGVDEAVNLIRGPRGTSIRLTYFREGVTSKEGKEVSIIRDSIKVPTVKLEITDDKIAYLQLFIFNKNVDSDFKKIAKQITESGAEKIILDLRNNPGGLLDSSINIASYFLDPDKTVVKERFANGNENVFNSRPNGLLKDYPLIILINKGSASASEILAGALKDQRNITLVGEKSFGKGSVQEIRELSNGASLKLTIAKWLTPGGISISDLGITPDVEVKMTEEDIKNDKDVQLDKAKELTKNL